jgi:hypothetical protein
MRSSIGMIFDWHADPPGWRVPQPPPTAQDTNDDRRCAVREAAEVQNEREPSGPGGNGNGAADAGRRMGGDPQLDGEEGTSETQTNLEPSRPSPKAICEAMAEKGDLLGLLGCLQGDARHLVHLHGHDWLSRCIYTKARDHDLPGLIEAAFSTIIGLGTFLMLRTHLYIQARLKEAEEYGGNALSNLPTDLTRDGWIERAEHQALFIAEMSSVWARVRHVSGMDNEKGKPSKPRRRTRPSAPVGANRGQANCRPAPAGDLWRRLRSLPPERFEGLERPVS